MFNNSELIEQLDNCDLIGNNLKVNCSIVSMRRRSITPQMFDVKEGIQEEWKLFGIIPLFFSRGESIEAHSRRLLDQFATFARQLSQYLLLFLVAHSWCFPPLNRRFKVSQP